jgi:radical SAM protein with 4Fe4S-binding SPASM domain
MRGTWTANIARAIKVLTTRTLEIEDGGLSYHFQGLPWRKISNLLRVESSMLLRTEKSWGRPTYLQMEASAVCNLRCALCPVTDGLQRPQGLMQFDLFKKVIDEIGEYVFILMLWDWGEPLLNPQIGPMIAYAQQRGIAVVCSTNGIPLAEEKPAADVVRSGLNTLIVSVDGIHQETYQHYRRGGSLEEVVKGIRTIVATRQQLSANNPRVILQFIVMKHNEHEIPEVKEMARTLGVDACTVRTLNPFKQLRSDAEEAPAAFSTTLPRYQRSRGNGGKTPPAQLRRSACPQLWNNSNVHWNGAVCSCCYDFAEQQPLGNLQNESFKEIWSGMPYRRLRRQLLRNPEELSNCRDCFYTWGDTAFDPIVETFLFK